MQTKDPSTDQAKFRREIDAILNGTSVFHRPKEKFDFSRFVFPGVVIEFIAVVFSEPADFSMASFTEGALFIGTTFTKGADFTRATFTQMVDFSVAEFIQGANFSKAIFNQAANFFRATFKQTAIFSGARFTQEANFFSTRFTRGANFVEARFAQEADFTKATFGRLSNEAHPAAAIHEAPAVADFRFAKFEHPEHMRFVQVNRHSQDGLRVRFAHCNVEGVQFLDVHWHRPGGRLLLQDELDLTEHPDVASSHEVVATAYRQLVSNFEKVRAFDLAEECMIGAMEMKRRDPAQFVFAKWLKPYYQRWPWLRWVGEQLSVANLYRVASNYGTSYQWAFLVLCLILFVIFPIVFSSIDIQPNPDIKTFPPDLPRTFPNAFKAFIAASWHSVEVATFPFRRESLYVTKTVCGRLMEIVEQVLVVALVSLLLLAIRRRFRH